MKSTLITTVGIAITVATAIAARETARGAASFFMAQNELARELGGVE